MEGSCRKQLGISRGLGTTTELRTGDSTKHCEVLMRSFILIVLTGLLVYSLQIPGSAAAADSKTSVSASADVTERITAVAKQWFYGFCTGNIDRSQLNHTVNQQITKDGLKKEGARLRSFGKPTSFKFLRSGPVGDTTAYLFEISFKSGNVIEAIAFDTDGKIAGIDFRTTVYTP
jgi:hypothetical protein